MELPTQPTQARNGGFPRNATWLIYGDPKAGKSTLASQFPNPIFLATEAGLSNLECYQVPVTSYDELVELGTLLKTEEHDFKTVVIDTIDVMGDIVQERTCHLLGIEHPADAGYGKGWYHFRKGFMGLLTSFSMLGLHLVLVSHAKERQDERNEKPIKIVPAVTGKLADATMAFCDVIFYCRIKLDEHAKPVRLLYSQGSDALLAGTRFTEIPSELPMSFEAINTCFNGSQP